VVNDESIEDVTSDTLPNDKFKQGDWVYCTARIITEDYKTPEVKSKYIRVLGLTPILALDPVPEISVPGEFRYQVKAYLPGQEPEEEAGEDTEEEVYGDFPENKGLQFSLISPLNMGIFMDPATGVISWEITKAVAEALQGIVEIKFKVSNPKGGSVTSSVKLSFKSQESDEAPRSQGKEIE